MGFSSQLPFICLKKKILKTNPLKYFITWESLLITPPPPTPAPNFDESLSTCAEESFLRIIKSNSFFPASLLPSPGLFKDSMPHGISQVPQIP